MTGEITLRGEVLPIGGLKEKLLAASRGGIKHVLIPVDNEKDLVEIPDNIKGNLQIRPVKWIDEVLQFALVRQPTPLATAVIEAKPEVAAVKRVTACPAGLQGAAGALRHVALTASATGLATGRGLP